MRKSLFLILFFIDYLHLQAQPLQHQHFRFVVIENETDSRPWRFPVDQEQIYLTSPHQLVIHKGETKYTITTQETSPLFKTHQELVVAYDPTKTLQLTIEREMGDVQSTMRVELKHLEDYDFAQLNFKSGHLTCDLSFGNTNPKVTCQFPAYKDLYNSGFRDISQALHTDFEPNWAELTDEALARKKRHQAWSNDQYDKMALHLENLIEQYFPNGLFDQYFTTTCYHYSRFSPYTNFHGNWTRDTTHRFENIRFYPTAWGDRYAEWGMVTFTDKTAHFHHPFSAIVFSKMDLDFLTQDEMARIVKKKLPNINFRENKDGSMALTMTFSNTAPEPVIHRSSLEPPVRLNAKEQDWKPRFLVHASVAPRENTRQPQNNTLYYFDAVTGSYIGKQTIIPAPLWDE